MYKKGKKLSESYEAPETCLSGGPGKKRPRQSFRADNETDIKQITAAQVNANIEVFFFSLNNT